MIIKNLKLEGYKVSYELHYSNNKGIYYIEYLLFYFSCINTTRVLKRIFSRNKIKIYDTHLKLYNFCQACLYFQEQLNHCMLGNFIQNNKKEYNICLHFKKEKIN